MEQEMILVSKKEYESLLEEVGILRNPEMMAAIREGEKARREGIKPWKLNI